MAHQKPTFALIDGDILVYRVGYASMEVTEEEAAARMRATVASIVFDGADCFEYRGFLTHSGPNYRHRLATLAPYKGNRKDVERPVHYEFLRKYLLEAMRFELSVDCEADDLLGCALVAHGDTHVVCTMDKDLDNVPGWHYKLYGKRNKETGLIEPGYLYYVTPQEAMVHFYRQCLTGDRVDNIPGLFDLFGVECGPKTAAEVVPDDATEEEAYCAVLSCFQAEAEKLHEVANLLWIQHRKGELWVPPTDRT